MSFAADRHARIVIIGAGAIGCSLAYHLARAGEKDVLVLEKAQITHGCTWHAAGLVGQLRGKKSLTRLMQNSVAVFDRLAGETGQAHGRADDRHQRHHHQQVEHQRERDAARALPHFIPGDGRDCQTREPNRTIGTPVLPRRRGGVNAV